MKINPKNEILFDEFYTKLVNLLNSTCMENASDTPDFILAEYLLDCLKTYNKVVVARDQWYGRGTIPVPSTEVDICP